MLETFCEFTFDAAHKTTPDTPLHGHTFKVRVVMAGEPVSDFGWSHDLREVEPLLERLKRQLDHTYLNDVAGLDRPTLENVARWIWGRLDGAIDGLARVEVRRGPEGMMEGVSYRGRG